MDKSYLNLLLTARSLRSLDSWDKAGFFLTQVDFVLGQPSGFAQAARERMTGFSLPVFSAKKKFKSFFVLNCPGNQARDERAVSKSVGTIN
jgi:hypothetical protein